jgi:hypothetical protein
MVACCLVWSVERGMWDGERDKPLPTLTPPRKMGWMLGWSDMCGEEGGWRPTRP